MNPNRQEIAARLRHLADEIDPPEIGAGRNRVRPLVGHLTVPEVAVGLSVTEEHVGSLIEEGLLSAIDVAGANNKSQRHQWRIPLPAYQAFRRARRFKSNRELLRS